MPEQWIQSGYPLKVAFSLAALHHIIIGMTSASERKKERMKERKLVNKQKLLGWDAEELRLLQVSSPRLRLGRASLTSPA